eukprot:398770_1
MYPNLMQSDVNIMLYLMVHLVPIITCFHRKIASFCILLNETITSYYPCDREILLLLFTGILSRVNAIIFGCYCVGVIKCFWCKKCTKQCKYTNVMEYIYQCWEVNCSFEPAPSILH